MDIEHLGRRVLDGESLTREQALRLADVPPAELPDLFVWSNRVRAQHFGNQVTFCSIGAGKLGRCGEDCAWCAQSAHHGACRSSEESWNGAVELAHAATSAVAGVAGCFGLVNSGRRPTAADWDRIDQCLSAIGESVGGTAGVCASLGELDAASASRLRDLGVRRYNHNLETSRRFFGQVVGTHAYDDRLATLRTARQAGLGLCCGGIFGLGESWADRVDLALTLRDEVQPEVVPLNFLHPIAGTPLADRPPLEPMECLHIVALFRMILPGADIKIAGGRHVNLRDLQSWAFLAGASSLLVGNYLTTLGRDVETDLQMARDLGLEVVRELRDSTESRRPTECPIDARG